MLEVFGIAFSIMGLLPSIASTLAYSIPAGPVGMVWVFVPITFRADMYLRALGLVSGIRSHFRRWFSHGDIRRAP